MATEAGLRPSGLLEMDEKKPIVGSGAGLIVQEIEFKFEDVLEWITEKEKEKVGWGNGSKIGTQPGPGWWWWCLRPRDCQR